MLEGKKLLNFISVLKFQTSQLLYLSILGEKGDFENQKKDYIT